jgi:hypothetical protein
MPRAIYLYPFRFFDPPRQRWIMARYVLQAPAIRCRYPDYEIAGPAEVRHVPDDPLALSAAGVARSPKESQK